MKRRRMKKEEEEKRKEEGGMEEELSAGGRNSFPTSGLAVGEKIAHRSKLQNDKQHRGFGIEIVNALAVLM